MTTAERTVLLRAVPLEGQGRWILVTSAFHMPRAMGGVLRSGVVEPSGVPQRLRDGTAMDQIGYNFAELLRAYRISDPTEAFFPQGYD